MISIEKLQFWQLYKNFPKNVGNLGKIIVATCFEKLPKVQQIAQPRHIASCIFRPAAASTSSSEKNCWFFSQKLKQHFN